MLWRAAGSAARQLPAVSGGGEVSRLQRQRAGSARAVWVVLPNLISGELRLKAAEASVGEATA